LLLRVARKNWQHIIVLRDFEPGSEPIQSGFEELGFHFVDSLPTTYLEVPWTSYEDYLSCLKSYYRSKLKKHLKINQNKGISHELRENFDDLADPLNQQWLVVHEQADEYQREVLTEAFYREFSTKLGDKAKVLLFYRDTDMVGHALLLMDGQLLRWLYFGRNDARNDSLYIYVANAVIETSIKLGARRLEMGLTTYSIKKDLGAEMSPIKIALSSPWKIVNLFISKVYPFLNRVPEIANKKVFKQDCRRSEHGK